MSDKKNKKTGSKITVDFSDAIDGNIGSMRDKKFVDIISEVLGVNKADYLKLLVKFQMGELDKDLQDLKEKHDNKKELIIKNLID